MAQGAKASEPEGYDEAGGDGGQRIEVRDLQQRPIPRDLQLPSPPFVYGIIDIITAYIQFCQIG